MKILTVLTYYRPHTSGLTIYAERLARYQGSVVVALSAKPVSFERLVLWLAQAQKKGIVLAPLSQTVTTAPK